jgi:hypothetical protein
MKLTDRVSVRSRAEYRFCIRAKSPAPTRRASYNSKYGGNGLQADSRAEIVAVRADVADQSRARVDCTYRIGLAGEPLSAITTHYTR